MKDKKLFKKALEGLVTEHTKTQKNILREVLKKNNGQGDFYDQPTIPLRFVMTKKGKPCLSNNAGRK